VFSHFWLALNRTSQHGDACCVLEGADEYLVIIDDSDALIKVRTKLERSSIDIWIFS